MTLPVLPLPRPFSFRELARATLGLGVLAAFGWAILLLAGAI